MEGLSTNGVGLRNYFAVRIAAGGKTAGSGFTPATKAQHGEHDENISFVQMANIIGKNEAEVVRDASFTIYREAAQYAKSKGVIIADTKFEFAFDEDGELILIDEVLTPDSSRFWPADSWRPGENPQSFDKQPLRDWLEKITWNKKPPPPTMPADVIAATASVIWTSASVCWERRIFEVHHWATYNLFQRDNKSKR